MGDQLNKRHIETEEDQTKKGRYEPEATSTETDDDLTNGAANAVNQNITKPTAFEMWKAKLVEPSTQQEITTSTPLCQRIQTRISELHVNQLQSERKIAGTIVKARPKFEYISNGGGKVQQFVLSDSSGDIQFSMFNDKLEKWEHFLKLNDSVEIQGFGLKKVSNNHSVTAHELELTIGNTTQFYPCVDVIPNYNMVEAVKINSLCETTYIDVMGLVVEIFPTREFANGKYQEFNIADKTGKISCKLWNDSVDEHELVLFQSIMIKLGKLTFYNGTSCVEINPGDSVLINSSREEAKELQQWFEVQNEESLAKYV